MLTAKHIHAVDSHTQGEPTRVVVGGVGPVPGRTMAQKMAHLSRHKDSLRTALMLEPRGHRDMFGSILFDPVSDGADLGIVFMDSGGYLTMCGHGTIGAVTVALETGLVAMQEPETVVRLDTPAGLVTARAKVEGRRVREVTFRNVPSFLYKKDIPLEVPGWGEVKAAIGFGGNFFVLVKAADLDLTISPDQGGRLAEAGMAVLEAVNRQVKVEHPLEPHINSVALAEFYGPPQGQGADVQNCVVFGRGQVDRSPCGTGTCAKMAVLHAGGKLELNRDFVHQSIIGTTFTGRLVEETTVGDLKAVVPEITGSAYITGLQQFVIDPDDPLSDGFLVG